MRKLISIVFIAGILFACDTAKKKETKEIKEPKMEKTEKATLGATRFEELKGYFVKNDVTFDKDLKFIAVSNLDEFNRYFGTGKTMNNEVTSTDFDKFNVAAVMLKPSNEPGKIKLIRYTSDRAKTIVSFEVVPGKEQNFTSTGILLFKIPKSKSSVDFVSGGETVNIKVQ